MTAIIGSSVDLQMLIIYIYNDFMESKLFLPSPSSHAKAAHTKSEPRMRKISAGVSNIQRSSSVSTTPPASDFNHWVIGHVWTVLISVEIPSQFRKVERQSLKNDAASPCILHRI